MQLLVIVTTKCHVPHSVHHSITITVLHICPVHYICYQFVIFCHCIAANKEQDMHA